MSEWKEYKLGEIAEISTGYAFKGDKYDFKGELRVVRGENVTIGKLRWDSEKYWNRSIIGLEQYYLRENDIVIGMDGSRIGHNRAIIKLNELPLILAQRVARLRAKENSNQGFIWYNIFSSNFKDYVEAIHTGTSIPHISQNQISNFEILLPPLPEQSTIASILSSLDDKIDLLHRQNATLEKMAETLFRQWFVEEAEESWEEKSLSEFITVKHGYAFKGELITPEPTHLKLVTPGNFMIGGGFKLDKFKYYTSEKFPESYIFKSDDLVVTMTDLSVDGDTLGYSALIPDSFGNEKYLHNQRVGKVEFKTDIGKFFIYHLMKTEEYQWYILSAASGTSIRHTSPTSICSYKFKLPPTNKIMEFENQYSGMREKIKKNQIQIRTLTSMRDNLLPKLMSGEVRVKI
jgi:type I restriction enzyme S subunit